MWPWDKPQPPNPLDPNNWSGDQRTGFLGSAGFQWVQGEGPTAIWEAPDGRRMTESNAFTLLMGGVDSKGKDIQPEPPKPVAQNAPQGDTSAQVDGAGVPYIIRNGRGYSLDGRPYNPVPVPVNPHPGQSSSYNVSQSYRDPADIKLERDSLNEKIRQAMIAEALDAEKLQFQRDVQRVNEEQGNKKLALDAGALAESISARIDRSSLERQRMQQDLQILDQQQAFQAQRDLMDTASRMYEGEQNRAQQADLAGQDTASRLYLADQQRAAGETQAARADATRRSEAAAGFAANGATDFGRLSAFLGNGGLLSTAIGNGQTAVTDQSLEPLGALLAPAAPVKPADSLDSYMARFKPQQQPGGGLNSIIAMLRGLGFGQRQNPAVTSAAVPGGGAGGAASSPPPGSTTQILQNSDNLATIRAAQSLGIDTSGIVKPMQDGGAVMGVGTMNKLMALAQMLGMQPKAVAGERGKPNGETVYSNGDVVVMPDRGMGMDKPMMANGGGVLNLLSPAWQYMQNAGQTALRRGGFTDTPTPVQFSDPGTDPALQQLAASTAAVTRGIPRSSFLNEIMRLTPAGMNRGLARRTY